MKQSSTHKALVGIISSLVLVSGCAAAGAADSTPVETTHSTTATAPTTTEPVAESESEADTSIPIFGEPISFEFGPITAQYREGMDFSIDDNGASNILIPDQYGSTRAMIRILPQTDVLALPPTMSESEARASLQKAVFEKADAEGGHVTSVDGHPAMLLPIEKLEDGSLFELETVFVYTGSHAAYIAFAYAASTESFESYYPLFEDFRDSIQIDIALPETGESASSDTENVSAEFKAAMDAYEAFFEDYVAYMKQYQANPTNLNLLTGLTGMMTQYTDTMDKLSQLQNDLSGAELEYYLQTMTRINQQLMSVI